MSGGDRTADTARIEGVDPAGTTTMVGITSETSGPITAQDLGGAGSTDDGGGVLSWLGVLPFRRIIPVLPVVGLLAETYRRYRTEE